MDEMEWLRMLDDRLAIVEALVLLGEPGHARRFVDIAEACTDEAELCLRIAGEWGLSEVQAQALSDVQFKKVTQKDRQEFLDELAKLKVSREELCAKLER